MLQIAPFTGSKENICPIIKVTRNDSRNVTGDFEGFNSVTPILFSEKTEWMSQARYVNGVSKVGILITKPNKTGF